MADATELLLEGSRGRRALLECVMAVEPSVFSAVVRLGHELDRSSRVVLFTDGGEVPPTDTTSPTAADVAALIRNADLTSVDHAVAHEALRRSVCSARYWQEPDAEDAVAALPEVRDALARTTEHFIRALPHLAATRRTAQWAVDWRNLADRAPLPSDAAALLEHWASRTRSDEERSARDRPTGPCAPFSGTWWSVPTRLLTTRGTVPDVLELVEDPLGWEVATVIPVRGTGRTLEVQSPAAWAELCRAYPFEVTASRRHDWSRITGRDGRWLIPDWGRVAQVWDAVHLTPLGYLASAARLIEIDAEYATVLAGWAPDSTIWLRDVAREWTGARQEWRRAHNGTHWVPASA